MSQHDPTTAPDSEPEPPGPTPATQARRPGEMRSAVPALCLFGVNLLLVAVLVSSSLWPSLFHLSQPQQVVPGAAPTATATVGPQPSDALPAAQTTVEATTQATTQATAQATTSAHASATATAPAQQPSPTTAPPTPTNTPPTPLPTWTYGGG